MTGIDEKGRLFTDEGIRWNHRFTIFDYDVTGKTVRAAGRRSWNASGAPVWELSEGDGMTATQVGSDAQIDMLIPAADLTEPDIDGRGVWELRIGDEIAIKNEWRHAPGAI